MNASVHNFSLFRCLSLIAILASHLIASPGHSQTTRSDVRRRQWPRIKFEDFYVNSGDGPLIDDNITETYVWTTIVTQIKATVWPTVTRIRTVSTPKPNPIVISSTPVLSCIKYWSQISYSLPTTTISYESVDPSLVRPSPTYAGQWPPPCDSSNVLWPTGPSSTLALSSADLSKSWLTSSHIPVRSDQPNKSVDSFDGLSELFSTKDYIWSPSLEINSNSYTISSIESSFEIWLTQSPGPSQQTPIYWPKASTESDKNSISGTFVSFWSSRVENMVSTGNPFITTIETSFESPLVSTQTMTESMSETIDRLESSPVASRGAATPSPTTSTTTANTSPVPVPLCPEGLHNLSSRAAKEDYLIRTVLNSTSSREPIDWIRSRIERNISRIFSYALSEEHNSRDRMAFRTRKLLSQVNYTNIEAKLFELSVDKNSDQMHVIYYLQRDGTLIPYEDAFRTLNFISDEKFSSMIGLTVIHKIKPYNDIKAAKTALIWWPFVVSAVLALILIACLISGLVFAAKYRSEKRKWMDAFYPDPNRVAPDSSHYQWTTVSKLVESTVPSVPQTKPKTKDNVNSSEFQYLRFESNGKQSKQKEVTKKGISKGTQMESSVEMQKQKVIPIGELIDSKTDSSDSHEKSDNQYYGSHFVTTREMETNSKANDSAIPIPRLISVQMSVQTESIIRAIRSELNKFGHNSNAIAFIDDTQPEESIISNSSEA